MVQITREALEAAVTKAMGWEPSETGPSYKQTRDEILAALSTIPAGGMCERVRHKKRGTEYTVMARGRLQVDGDLDNEKVVIYSGDDDQVWCRPEYEFNDGRFEDITSAPGAPSRYINRANLKVYVLISETDGVVSFKPEGRETLAYLGRAEFDKRFRPYAALDATISVEEAIAIRDALIANNVSEAYHQLYQAVDPAFARFEPWAAVEASIPTPPQPIASDTTWTTRDQAFTDFWEKLATRELSDVGKARQAFMAGMEAATHFERAEASEAPNA